MLKILKKLPFYEQLNPKTLHVEYQFVLKCARDYITELKTKSVVEQVNIFIFKKFIKENGENCPALFKFLHFVFVFLLVRQLLRVGGPLSHFCTV